MKKKGQVLTILNLLFLLSAPAFAQAINFGDNSTDFGLFPTTTETSHKLPDCQDVDHIESAPGIPAHGGYCLGPIVSPKTDFETKYAVTIIEEYFDKDGIIRVVRRNPVLISIASFYSFCRPKGGILSSDGLYCEYRIKF
jgi:hypothetical protein